MGAAASITVICLNCSLCASSALQVSAGGGNAFDDFRFCISCERKPLDLLFKTVALSRKGRGTGSRLGLFG